MKPAREQQLHMKLVGDLLQFLNNHSDAFVLKGGTALMLCYGLDRFSEGIDLDMLSQNNKDDLQNILKQYCSNTDQTVSVHLMVSVRLTVYPLVLVRH